METLQALNCFAKISSSFLSASTVGCGGILPKTKQKFSAAGTFSGNKLKSDEHLWAMPPGHYYGFSWPAWAAAMRRRCQNSFRPPSFVCPLPCQCPPPTSWRCCLMVLNLQRLLHVLSCNIFSFIHFVMLALSRKIGLIRLDPPLVWNWAEAKDFCRLSIFCRNCTRRCRIAVFVIRIKA